jgi:NitT/TauT family transport system substrate-binding protein
MMPLEGEAADRMRAPTEGRPMNDRRNGLSRRQFVQGAAGVGLSAAGLALLAGCGSQQTPISPVGERSPETTALRLVRVPALCVSPEYVADELLRAEGFTDVQHVQKEGTREKQIALARGDADITTNFVAPLVVQIDAGDPIVILSGLHAGCFELFGTDHVRAIRDLRGKTVGVPELGSAAQVFLASMAAYVGLDPSKDVTWAIHPSAEAIQLLAEGRVDAFLGFPPDPQELRARQIGHPIVNSVVDRPWSDYFCCMVVGNREFVRSHPAATKRALRAILKAAELCSREPERSAQLLVDQGYTSGYDYAFQLLQDLPYGKWREYDPEDTIRFYALRLREAGMIRSTPDKILAQGTDWSYLNELKRELKG